MMALFQKVIVSGSQQAGRAMVPAAGHLLSPIARDEIADAEKL
jgi:hypothetical protein